MINYLRNISGKKKSGIKTTKELDDYIKIRLER